MNFKSYVCVAAAMAVSTSVYAVAATAEAGDVSSTLTISRQTEVPGLTLKPGEYSIQIVDHLSDRVIVRIDSTNGKDHTLFLAVPNAKIGGNGAGPVTWPSAPKGADALRGYAFPGGSTVEFVYPKAEAAALAKVNTTRVIAVDPESEGKSPQLKNLSKDDMTMVNLWMLSLTSTGPKEKTPALAAKKYEADSTPSSTVVAAAPAPAPVAPVATVAPPTQVASNDVPPPPTAKRKPVIAKLPKTASSLPLVWMLGLVSLFGALGLRFGRRFATDGARG